MEREIAWGALINSALYFVGCFVAGVLFDAKAPILLALAGVGAAFLSYTMHLSGREPLSGFCSIASLVAGVLAGAFVLFA